MYVSCLSQRLRLIAQNWVAVPYSAMADYVWDSAVADYASAPLLVCFVKASLPVL